MLAVEIHPLCLSERTFVPIKSDPTHAVYNGLSGGIRRTILVCVFDAQDKRTLGLTGEEPIEERRTNAADVQVSGWTGSKTDSDWFHMGCAFMYA